MTTSRLGRFRLIASLCNVFFLGALVFIGCGDGDSTNAPTTDLSQPAFLQTPRADRRLPDDAFAIAWQGEGTVDVIRREPMPAGYLEESVTSGLHNPVDFAFLPDGRILVTEQYTGLIRLIEEDVLREEPFAQIERVVQDQLEQGLLGIAIDPDFERNRWVYVFYVESAEDVDTFPSRSVLLRLTERQGYGVEPLEVMELPFGPAGQHNGGGIRFGPDGKLYLTLGDTSRPELAADVSEPVGKILRFERDGSVPNDNPFIDRSDADPRVYASGFRNVYGIAFHPNLTNGLLALDNAEFEGDEINIVRAGLDYGWPSGDGEPPVWLYLNNVGPAGATVYTGDRLPEFQGDLFFCQFHHGSPLHRVRLSADLTRVEFDTVIAIGCSAAIGQGPDGYLYFLDRMKGNLNRIVGP